jgi:hypothetical protein
VGSHYRMSPEADWASFGRFEFLSAKTSVGDQSDSSPISHCPFIREVCSRFVALCRTMGLFVDEVQTRHLGGGARASSFWWVLSTLNCWPGRWPTRGKDEIASASNM